MKGDLDRDGTGKPIPCPHSLCTITARTRAEMDMHKIQPHLPPTPQQVFLAGLSVMETVLDRMTPAEQRTALDHLTDRYSTTRRADT